MAVIYRKSLTGEAAQIKNQALKRALSDPLYGAQISALNQQRTVLEAQQQGLISGVQATLKDVSNNIYQAQRQARANSAALGYVGGLSQLRYQSDLQGQISNEYASIINQAEQGAISIAGQQTALNTAEVQLAQAPLLEQTVDYFIEEGREDIISRDTARELSYQFQQSGLGILKGLGLGFGVSRGLRGVLNPKTGGFVKGVAGALIGGAAGYTLDSIISAAGGPSNLTGALLGGGIPGLVAGVGFKSAHKYANARALELAAQTGRGSNKIIESIRNGASAFNPLLKANEGVRRDITGWIKYLTDQTRSTGKRNYNRINEAGTNWFVRGVRGAKYSPNAKQAAKWTAQQFKLTKGLHTAGKLVGKINPITAGLTLGSGLLFGILDGIKARNTKFYKIDYDAFANTDVARQFDDFGVNIEAIKDIVYNKRG